MSSNYHPWNICTRIDGVQNMEYTQLTNSGIICCNKPNIRDIIQSFDSQNVPLFLTYTDIITHLTNPNNTLKAAAYLWMYQYFVNHGCKYFKVETPKENKNVEYLIDCEIKFNTSTTNHGFNTVEQTKIQKFFQNHEDFYKYVLLQANIFTTYIYNETEQQFIYTQFIRVDVTNKKNIECVVRKTDSLTDLKSDYIPKYLLYEEEDNIHINEYIPICCNGTTNKLNLLGHSAKIININSCNSSSCNVEKFKQFAGQLMTDIYQEYEMENKPLYYHSRILLGCIIFFICIVIFLFYLYYIKHVNKFENITHKYHKHALDTNLIDNNLSKHFEIHKAASELEHI